ncbi:MAG: D-glycero-beta-D-manno-heptose 1,7-bisphosphate 7-phosphatase [Porticoccaceae bacterium]
MPLIILDRDGVINADSDDYIKTLDEWQALPGSIEAIAALCKAGFTVVVATNQSGLSRGLFDLDDLEAMHEQLRELVEAAGGEIAGIFYCPHHPDDNCDCRKPKPGLFDAIARELELDLSSERTIAVGDSFRDLEAAVESGCRPVLVRTGKGSKTESELVEHRNPIVRKTTVYDDLRAAATEIINGNLR